MKRIVVITIIVILIAFTQTGLSQVPPNGEHVYGGTQDGNQTGTFTGSINDGSVVMDTTTTQIIREHRIFQQTVDDENDAHTFVIDPTPFQVGDIDKSKSKTRIEVFAYTSSSSQTSNTLFEVGWFDGFDGINQVSNCNIHQTRVEIPGGATAGAGGAGESRLVCDLDTYRDSTFNIEATHSLSTNTDTSAPRFGMTVWQTEVVNITTPGTTGTMTGNVSGTTSGSYTGEHRGEIEQINATSNNNETSVENLTATNLTFSNIFGAIQLEFDLPFLLLVAAILLIVLAEWRKDPFILLLSVLPLIFYAIEVDNNNWRVIIVAFTLYAAARASMVIYETKKEGEEDE